MWKRGHRRIILTGYVRAGLWKAGRAWPGNLDFTQQAIRSLFFFQVFEQEREMTEILLQGSWSFTG